MNTMVIDVLTVTETGANGEPFTTAVVMFCWQIMRAETTAAAVVVSYRKNLKKRRRRRRLETGFLEPANDYTFEAR